MKYDKQSSIVIPSPGMEKENNNLLFKDVFKADKHTNTELTDVGNNAVAKPGFMRQEHLSDSVGNTIYKFYNNTHHQFICKVVQGVNADINASFQFYNFDIEPSWMSKKHYWDNTFNSRYELLMQNLTKWPSLHVILMPFSHVDTIWKRSFEHYHNDTVTKILSNIVKKLQFYKKLTFTWNEVSHLSQWWKVISQRTRMRFRKLLRSGRLEITTGGWVETEEATSHLFGLLHQLIEGHQWLKHHLRYIPRVGWLTSSVTHSPTLPYLLSAAGITKFVIANVHYSWEQFFAEFQISDFVWVQNFDNDKNSVTHFNQALDRIGNNRYPKHSVLTHYLQFNSDNFKGCGPESNICKEFDFRNSNKNIDIHEYNIKSKAEKLLEQYSKTGTLSKHNVIIAPLGGQNRYEFPTEFDLQYNNYQTLADFVNFNENIYSANMQFGTPKDFFNKTFSRLKKYPSLQGDFLNFADTRSGKPAYWSGFFTSRPSLKVLLRRLQSTMRTSEILLSFALNFNVFPQHNMTGLFEILHKARENVARLQDRHVIGGAISFNVLQYVHKQILMTVKDCWHIQEVATSLLTSKPGDKSIYLQKLMYREGELITVPKMINTGDQIYVFNSLSQERTEIIELITKYPNMKVVDHNKNDVTIQINPVWAYTPDNILMLSSTVYKVSFAIVVPPLTLELYKIKKTHDATQNAATIYCSHCLIDKSNNSASESKMIFPFNIQPIQPGDIQLESYKHRVIIDEFTGLLKIIIEKETNIQKKVLVDYGAFRSANTNIGMFLFNIDVERPLEDILQPFRDGTRTKTSMIIAGEVTSEMTSIFGHILQHSTKLHNLVNNPIANCISIVSKVGLELSSKNRDLEVFLSINTDISNGNNPEIFIDNNGFQYTPRRLDINKRIESNMYPMTSMVYIQDGKSRLTVITDHAQGITALEEGQLVVMLEKRVFHNDSIRSHEGVADNSASYHRHYMLLENFIENQSDHFHGSELQLPSFSAAYLANALDFKMELFLVDKTSSDLSYFSFLPLIKTSFPCDIAVINFRTIINAESPYNLSSTMALLVLHRQSFSCHLNYSFQQQCDGDNSFSLDNILRNIESVSLTNLVGTDEGIPVNNISLDNFPAMGLMTLKVFF